MDKTQLSRLLMVLSIIPALAGIWGAAQFGYGMVEKMRLESTDPALAAEWLAQQKTPGGSPMAEIGKALRLAQAAGLANNAFAAERQRIASTWIVTAANGRQFEVTAPDAAATGTASMKMPDGTTITGLSESVSREAMMAVLNKNGPALDKDGNLLHPELLANIVTRSADGVRHQFRSDTPMRLANGAMDLYAMGALADFALDDSARRMANGEKFLAAGVAGLVLLFGLARVMNRSSANS